MKMTGLKTTTRPKKAAAEKPAAPKLAVAKAATPAAAEPKTPANPKREVTFSIVAPDAKVVTLAGSFTNWDQAPVELKREKNGVWKKTLTLAPGQYEYRLLVDGQWQDDPQCDQHVPNPFGTQNCLRMVA